MELGKTLLNQPVVPYCYQTPTLIDILSAINYKLI